MFNQRVKYSHWTSHSPFKSRPVHRCRLVKYLLFELYIYYYIPTLSPLRQTSYLYLHQMWVEVARGRVQCVRL